jgi:hypothetical protein
MIDTTCPMCSRCNKVSKTHTNIGCPCGCWYSPPQLSPTGDDSKRDVTNADFMRVIEETQSAMMTQNMNLRQSLDRCMAFLQSMSTLESHDIGEYGWHCPKCPACKIAKFLREEEAIAKW